MKNGLQEQQHQNARIAKSNQKSHEKEQEASGPSWQLYFVLAVIIVGALLLAAKASGLF